MFLEQGEYRRPKTEAPSGESECEGEMHEISHHINRIEESVAQTRGPANAAKEEQSQPGPPSELSESTLTRRNWNLSSTLSLVSEMDQRRKTSFGFGENGGKVDGLREKRSSVVSWDRNLREQGIKKKHSLPIHLAQVQIRNFLEANNRTKIEQDKKNQQKKKYGKQRNTNNKSKTVSEFKEDHQEYNKNRKKEMIKKKLFKQNTQLDALQEGANSGSSYVTLDLSESDSLGSAQKFGGPIECGTATFEALDNMQKTQGIGNNKNGGGDVEKLENSRPA